MVKKNTLIFGSTRGIGKVIFNVLKKDNHNILSFSRKKIVSNKKNIQIDLSDLNSIAKNLNNNKNIKYPIDNIIFSQRYRGKIC